METQAEQKTTGRSGTHARSSVPPLRADNHPINAQPRPGPRSVTEVVIALAGFIFAMLGPYLVVAPGEVGASTGRVWTAFSMTVLGVVVAITSCTVAYRRTQNWSWLVLGIMPGVMVLICGMLISTVLLLPS